MASFARVLRWLRLTDVSMAAGAAAARTMLTHVLGPVDDIEAQAPFELFAHVTKFLGWRVTMLGLFNGHGLDAAECEAIVRVTKGVE